MAPVALPRTVCAGDVMAAHGEREQTVVAHPIVIAQIFVPEREPEEALGEQALEGMLATTGIAVTDEAGCQALGQADALVDGLQQQGAAIGGHAAAIKAGTHFAAALVGKIDCDTVCGYGVGSWIASNLLITRMLPQFHAP